MIWLYSFLMRDLLLIKNQIPYFVLQKLFQESRTANDTCTLPSLILLFFSNSIDRPTEVLEPYVKSWRKAIAQSFQKEFIRNLVDLTNAASYNPPLKLIQSATNLIMDGFTLKVNLEAGSFLDIKFRNGVFQFRRST